MVEYQLGMQYIWITVDSFSTNEMNITSIIFEKYERDDTIWSSKHF